MQITQHPSPNFGERRLGARPDLIVLHYTAMGSAEAALTRLCDPACEVSAHYLIGADGHVFEMVDEDQRAWHAGAGTWGSCTDVNSRSIGIELANDGISPFAAAQMETLEQLLDGIKQRRAISRERILAHSDMAPCRKSDPGARFDWRRLALSGLSVWPDPAEMLSPDAEQFCAYATAFGYSADQAHENLLSAFRLRFRPWGTGPLDATDMGLIANLAHRFPVDQTPLST